MGGQNPGAPSQSAIERAARARIESAQSRKEASDAVHGTKGRMRDSIASRIYSILQNSGPADKPPTISHEQRTAYANAIAEKIADSSEILGRKQSTLANVKSAVKETIDWPKHGIAQATTDEIAEKVVNIVKDAWNL